MLLLTALFDCGSVTSLGHAPLFPFLAYSLALARSFSASFDPLVPVPDPQLAPSFPACSEAGVPVGDGFLAKLFQIPPLDF